MTQQKIVDVTEFTQEQIANLVRVLDDLAITTLRIRYESVVPTTATLRENEILIFDDGAGTKRLYTITGEGNLGFVVLT